MRPRHPEVRIMTRGVLEPVINTQAQQGTYLIIQTTLLSHHPSLLAFLKKKIFQQLLSESISFDLCSKQLMSETIMPLFSHHEYCHRISLLLFILFFLCRVVSGTTFTMVNKCDFTVWPGILASAGSPRLETTGFELAKGGLRALPAPPGWSGRFWARTGCTFDASGLGSCALGDCGSGQVECNGEGATPPATLAEFTLGSQDFYDVSMVDGYNLPVTVEAKGGSGGCATTGCATDLNRSCPEELKAADGAAGGPASYIVYGSYGSPDTCKPSFYSEVFKSACPKSYSYAYDDSSSTFTCSGADYTITFCPSSQR
ncbi:PREDICTED: thaumatin-like protein 1b [Tarenaya hassleriana]|uniref:thaumatin-like protein 1b n=1 Tax=Tarenaya hassleriana TaxID=28532 RepID=UPI00053C39A9|nr:PREDICTED: thaumatin-like protein 1b [Tarenaya hassleriana]